MDITEYTWREEQERVDRVTKKMTKRIDTLEAKIGQVKTDVLHIRKHFWDEVTINLNNLDDIVETHFSIKQQAEVLSERERRYRYSTEALNTLRRLVQSPYFGRVDFTEEGAGETEQIYLGIGSFRDDDDTFLVFDWRAPISSLYYDYSPGSVEYKAPGGTVVGTMSRKRQFVIRDGSIHFMFDTGMTIGDELLMQMLSRHSDAQMKSIVSTIQKEQNRIIRNDTSQMLIVQGAAGSGKTSAALQRVAYLLYKYRETLVADQMVLFSPNPMFNNYVSTVLPELGEENMQQTTFQEYLQRRLGKEFKLEDPFTQMEYILESSDTPDYEARMSGIQYKSSVAYLKAIQTYKELLEQEGMIFKSVRFQEQTIVSAKQIYQRFYEFDPIIRLANRIDLTREWLQSMLVDFEEAKMHEAWVEDAIELLEPEDYQRAYQQLRQLQKGKKATFDDFEKEKEFLSRMVVREQLKPVRRWIKRLQFVDTRSLYRLLFTNESLFTQLAGNSGVPKYWRKICQQTILNLGQSKLAYEDATPFLYLKELIQGQHSNNAVRHTIVDEAQDYSLFQFELLKRLFPRAKMTALGDLNQAIYAHDNAFGTGEVMNGLYGEERTEVIRLTNSYRSTKEIVQFTRKIVGGGEDIVPFNRSGDKPQIIVAKDPQDLNRRIAEDIKSLHARGYKSIAVICKTAKETANVFSAFCESIPVRLITKSTPVFEKATVIIPAYLAKGVEFDVVLIYNGSKKTYCRENERKLFYTACTRAMHVLHIYAIGELSRFIAAQNPDTYVTESTLA